MSLLLDALKRAESQKKRGGATDNLSGAIPDIDFSAIDPVALQRNGAKNLFNAKQTGYGDFGKAKLISMLGATALLMGAAGFYAWYWYNTSYASGSKIGLGHQTLPPIEMRASAALPAPSQPTPAPAAATPVPTATPVAVADVPAPTGAPSIPAVNAKTELPKTAAAATAKNNVPIKPAVVAKPKPRVIATLTPKPPSAPLEKNIGIASGPVTSSPAQIVSTAGPTNPNNNNIQLRRSNQEIFAINPDLGAAYQALIAGNLAEARQKYEMVLQKDPLNIDAELGLATISAKNNDSADAARRYKRVLDLSPKNPYAIAGNAALLNDLPQTENQLRAQMAQQPQSAPLAAALGNVFASQNRWNEAQQAYFDAVRIDANNPDYAFNLAVSLDQINQPKLALENYQKALSLSGVRPSQFSKEAVTTRIAELSKIR